MSIELNYTLEEWILKKKEAQSNIGEGFVKQGNSIQLQQGRESCVWY